MNHNECINVSFSEIATTKSIKLLSHANYKNYILTADKQTIEKSSFLCRMKQLTISEYIAS